MCHVWVKIRWSKSKILAWCWWSSCSSLSAYPYPLLLLPFQLTLSYSHHCYIIYLHKQFISSFNLYFKSLPYMKEVIYALCYCYPSSNVIINWCLDDFFFFAKTMFSNKTILNSLWWKPLKHQCFIMYLKCVVVYVPTLQINVWSRTTKLIYCLCHHATS